MRLYHPSYISGSWQVVSTSNGIDDRRNEGPRWPTAREAAAFITRLEEMPQVSPLRSRSGPNEHSSLGGDEVGSSAQNEADRLDPGPLTLPEAGDGFTPVGSEVSPGLWPD